MSELIFVTIETVRKDTSGKNGWQKWKNSEMISRVSVSVPDKKN
jgi:hypothetical protein